MKIIYFTNKWYKSILPVRIPKGYIWLFWAIVGKDSCVAHVAKKK